jgi:hypothetical protein
LGSSQLSLFLIALALFLSRVGLIESRGSGRVLKYMWAAHLLYINSDMHGT